MSGSNACVDCDTEYFNGYEWKKISEYTQGEQVLQYNEDGTAELVYPSNYIKNEADYLWHFETSSLNQCLSDEHTVVYKNYKDDIKSCKMYDFINKHNKTKSGNDAKFITSFKYGGTGINVSWRFIISNACIDSSSANGGKEIGTLWNILNCRKIEKENNKCYFIHKDNGLIDAGLTPSNEPGRISNEWITKSLRRNELYRYGIILYDKSGYASPVKWIADIRTPNLYDKYFI